MKRISWVFISLIILFSACQTQKNQAAETDQEETASKSPLARFDEAIAAYEAADKEVSPPEDAFLFTGSSSIRMWQSLADDMAPIPVINRGFGGSTMPELIYYADRIIFPYKPRGILIYEGDNDITSDTMSAEDVLGNLKRLHSMVQEKLPGTPMWFIAIKPSVARKHLFEKMKKTNALVAAFAAETPTLTYIDIVNPMMGDNGSVRTDIFRQDSLHMNEKGYKIWTEVIRPVLEGYANN